MSQEAMKIELIIEAVLFVIMVMIVMHLWSKSEGSAY